jgi:hypothetical protein
MEMNQPNEPVLVSSRPETSAAPTTGGTPAAPPTVTTSQVIRHAAEILSKQGWNQGSYMSNDGRVCATFALYQSERELIWEEGPLLHHSLKAVDIMQKFTGALSLAFWNDMYTTTAEDVFLLFKNAAQLAEQQGD